MVMILAMWHMHKLSVYADTECVESWTRVTDMRDILPGDADLGEL